VVFASTFEANHVHRLVLDEEVLAPGEACAWIDEGETVCTAHTREELAALVQGTLDELGLIREAEEDTFRG
jgi:hypothetical protein